MVTNIRRLAVGALVACVGVLAPKNVHGERVPVGTDKAAATPHFYQGDPRGHFENDGSNYCCPTAVSDSFMYLAAHGFPNLLPCDGSDPTECQAKMIRRLASENFMATDPSTGTDVAQAFTGIHDYVEAAGYSCKRIEYRGWRPGPKSATRAMPSIDWIEKAVADPSGAAWVNIGWYVRGSRSDEWKRVGGHWVEVVGYGSAGRTDSEALVIDNPAVRSVGDLSACVMTAEQMDRGRLTGNYKGLPMEAAGVYRLSGPGVSMSRKFDAAFLDGAIVLVVGRVKW